MAIVVSRTVYCGDTQNRHAVPPTESIYQASNRYLKACLTNVRKNPRDGHRHGIIRLFIFTGLQKSFANNKPPFHQSLPAVTTKINWSRHGSNIQPSHIIEKKETHFNPNLRLNISILPSSSGFGSYTIFWSNIVWHYRECTSYRIIIKLADTLTVKSTLLMCVNLGIAVVLGR